MATPHIAAQPGDFAPDVLMPGDPLRARRIAKVLTDARLVTEVRGIAGFTGTWEGRPVSVLASGMGVPSISIYATELFRFYGVRRIVRIGTCGGIGPHLALGDVVVATAAHTDSAVTATRLPGVHYSHAPSFALAAAAVQAAHDEPGTTVHAGAVLTSDAFYSGESDLLTHLAARGTLAVEMEAAGLYATADVEHGEALALMTVSDLIGRDVEMSAAERETTFDRALRIALAALAAA
ncbi:purine-nucleoside phosphorylase [Cellulomonas soli]|uniref:Uridine phosphorylase n=1 Tax=Cellulomonas soli TaxID=931535 RepID=A0A512PBX7_9CELL|nr:purine-nucleoside phosphorylase [Cellulomonas soli]NYI58278.1 purine-nucleoside phosphorylase [Cellulomonas soli]GEP68698.1 purine nucleoside phosphorylase DeoD-type [Cellulomonas soli]